MQTRKLRFITFCIGCLLMTTAAVALTMLGAASGNTPRAFAMPLPPPTPTPTPTAVATSTPSTLSMAPGSASHPTAITLNGSNQPESFTVPISVNDNTGSGAGWDLTVSATQFSNGGHTLSTGATSVTGVNESCASGTCTAPINGVSYTLSVPSDGSTSTKFYNAAINTGKGNFTITPTFSVTMPPTAYAGTYSSVLTISITSGP